MEDVRIEQMHRVGSSLVRDPGERPLVQDGVGIVVPRQMPGIGPERPGLKNCHCDKKDQQRRDRESPCGSRESTALGDDQREEEDSTEREYGGVEMSGGLRCLPAATSRHDAPRRHGRDWLVASCPCPGELVVSSRLTVVDDSRVDSRGEPHATTLRERAPASTRIDDDASINRQHRTIVCGEGERVGVVCVNADVADPAHTKRRRRNAGPAALDLLR